MTVTDTSTPKSVAMDYYGTHVNLDTMYRARLTSSGDSFLCFRNSKDDQWVKLTTDTAYWLLSTATDVPRWIVDKYGEEYRGCYFTPIDSEQFNIYSEVASKTAWDAEHPAEPVVDTELDIAQRTITMLQAEVSRLTSEVHQARYRGERALEARNEEIRAALIEEGERRDWCDELDEFLEAHGFEPRTRDYDVEVSFTFTLSTTVSARNDSDASDIVANMISTSCRVDPFGTGSEYVDFDYEFNDVSVA